jgi:hypothetical protein
MTVPHSLHVVLSDAASPPEGVTNLRGGLCDAISEQCEDLVLGAARRVVPIKDRAPFWQAGFRVDMAQSFGIKATLGSIIGQNAAHKTGFAIPFESASCSQNHRALQAHLPMSVQGRMLAPPAFFDDVMRAQKQALPFGEVAAWVMEHRWSFFRLVGEVGRSAAQCWLPRRKSDVFDVGLPYVMALGIGKHLALSCISRRLPLRTRLTIHFS